MCSACHAWSTQPRHTRASHRSAVQRWAVRAVPLHRRRALRERRRADRRRDPRGPLRAHAAHSLRRRLQRTPHRHSLRHCLVLRASAACDVAVRRHAARRGPRADRADRPARTALCAAGGACRVEYSRVPPTAEYPRADRPARAALCAAVPCERRIRCSRSPRSERRCSGSNGSRGQRRRHTCSCSARRHATWRACIGRGAREPLRREPSRVIDHVHALAPALPLSRLHAAQSIARPPRLTLSVGARRQVSRRLCSGRPQPGCEVHARARALSLSAPPARGCVAAAAGTSCAHAVRVVCACRRTKGRTRAPEAHTTRTR